MPEGSVSVSVTLCASLAPLFVTVTLYETLFPAMTVIGPVFVTARSASATWNVIAPLNGAQLLDGVGVVDGSRRNVPVPPEPPSL